MTLSLKAKVWSSPGKSSLVCVYIVNRATSSGASALYKATTRGHAEVVSTLLRGHADPNQATFDTGSTPCLIAAELGRTEAFLRLARFPGTDLNKANFACVTPLICACLYGRVDMVRALLAPSAPSISPAAAGAAAGAASAAAGVAGVAGVADGVASDAEPVEPVNTSNTHITTNITTNKHHPQQQQQQHRRQRRGLRAGHGPLLRVHLPGGGTVRRAGHCRDATGYRRHRRKQGQGVGLGCVRVLWDVLLSLGAMKDAWIIAPAMTN